ncbi:MAG: hypothetical protein LBU50_07095 [Cellulomonas sp.]|jgi:hypothetical protein|nr:hypothetical protein [Cellulomonas sp.]
MSVVALVSASGSPGVTVAALSMVRACPGPAVLVEADLTGSSVLPGFLGGHVAAGDRGLVPGLVVAHSHGALGERFVEQTLPLFESPTGQRRLLPGLRAPGDAAAAVELWPALGDFLRSFGAADAVVDAGRVGAPFDPRDELLARADRVLLVTRSNLPAVWAARGVVASRPSVVPGTWGVLVVGPGRPYGADEVASAVGLPLFGTLAWDPRAAEVLAFGGKEGRSATGPLARSAAVVVTGVLQSVMTVGGRR